MQQIAQVATNNGDISWITIILISIVLPAIGKLMHMVWNLSKNHSEYKTKVAEEYATKVEVRELKDDLKDNIKDVKDSIISTMNTQHQAMQNSQNNVVELLKKVIDK